MELLLSIPQPKLGDDQEELDLNGKISTGNFKDRAKIKAIMVVQEIKADTEKKAKKLAKKTHRKSLVYKFKLGEVSILLYLQNQKLLVKNF